MEDWMRERPILFSPHMVRAILGGSKTQTRRVVKPQPGDEVGDFLTQLWPCRRKQYEYMGDQEQGHEVSLKPYAFIGDHLWVRETIGEFSGPTDAEGRYTADGTKAHDGWFYSRPVQPSIHMPRWASRITLEVTDIRVERLQDISEEDAKAEGCSAWFGHDVSADEMETARDQFQRLWNKINAKKYPWDSNPWVWVVEFKRIED